MRASCLACRSNVATFTALMLLEKGATVLAMSDSKGYLHAPEGLSKEQVEEVSGAGAGAGAAWRLLPDTAPLHLPAPPQISAIKSKHSGSLADFKAEGVQYVGDRCAVRGHMWRRTRSAPPSPSG
jgi:hypothetical protein